VRDCLSQMGCYRLSHDFLQSKSSLNGHQCNIMLVEAFLKETRTELCLKNLLNRRKFPISVGIVPVIMSDSRENLSAIVRREKVRSNSSRYHAGSIMVMKVVAYLVLWAVQFLLASNLQGYSFLGHRMPLLKEEETSISPIHDLRRVLTSKRETIRYLLSPVNVPISVGIWPLRLVSEMSAISVNIPNRGRQQTSPRNAELC
jgi:hypothetical protein